MLRNRTKFWCSYQSEYWDY